MPRKNNNQIAENRVQRFRDFLEACTEEERVFANAVVADLIETTRRRNPRHKLGLKSAQELVMAMVEFYHAPQNYVEGKKNGFGKRAYTNDTTN